MANGAGLPAKHAALANDSAARHTAGARHRRVSTDDSIVRDLTQIIDMHTVFDHCVSDRATVNRRIGADFNIVTNADAANLWHFDPAFGRVCVAKSVSSDNRTRVKQTALADLNLTWQRYVSNKTTVVTDVTVRTDHTSRTHIDTFTNECTLTDERKGVYLCATCHICSVGYHSRRMYTGDHFEWWV